MSVLSYSIPDNIFKIFRLVLNCYGHFHFPNFFSYFLSLSLVTFLVTPGFFRVNYSSMIIFEFMSNLLKDVHYGVYILL